MLTGLVVAAALLAGWYVLLRPTDGHQPSAATASPSPIVTTAASPTLSPTPTAPSTQDEYQQVSAVQTVLDQSAQSRSQLHTALQALYRPCGDIRSAEGSIAQVLQQRDQEISAARSLDLSAVPVGSQLRDAMVVFLQGALAADREYHQAALDAIGGGCGAAAAAFQRGDQISQQQAQPAKLNFFTLWTPLAASFAITPVHTAADV